MRVLVHLFAIATLSLASLAACGGPSDSPPKPLARHFDDMFIADIPLDQKQSVVQTQNDWSVAKMENAKAEADFNEANAQMTAVKNDQKGTRLAIDTAISNKKQAESSADNNRINQAAKELHAAEMLAKAADARLKYHAAYRDWLKRHWRFTQENMYWREAQYELAKSTLAQRSNKSPRGVQYDWFPKQEAERSKRTQSAKAKADEVRGRAVTARDSWLKLQASADKENGRPSQLPDPMAPKEVPPAVEAAPAPPAPASAASGTLTPAPAAPAPTE